MIDCPSQIIFTGQENWWTHFVVETILAVLQILNRKEDWHSYTNLFAGLFQV